jgi:mono/diheme cytochrome c family protein
MADTARVESRVADFVRQGHFEMPAQAIRDEDIADVAAYIRSLSSPAAKR